MKLIQLETRGDAPFLPFLTNSILHNLPAFAAEKGWHINSPELLDVDEATLVNAIWQLKGSEQSRWQRPALKAHYRERLSVVNALLYEVAQVLEWPDSICVYPSKKEMQIQEARRKWRKAMAQTEKLRLAYITEKGDFYKHHKQEPATSDS